MWEVGYGGYDYTITHSPSGVDMRIICRNCSVEMVKFKTGVTIADYRDGEETPFRLYFADMWGCKGCGNEVISGFGDSAYMHKDSTNLAVFKQRVRLERRNNNLIEVR